MQDLHTTTNKKSKKIT